MRNSKSKSKCFSGINSENLARSNSPTRQPFAVREEAMNYTKEQQRVVDYLTNVTQGAALAADDPIGLILASHAFLKRERDIIRQSRERILIQLERLQRIARDTSGADSALIMACDNALEVIKKEGGQP